jgi:hypothetical protein
MNARRFQDVRIEQCEAARRIKEEHGVKSAFDYIVLGGDPRALGAYRTDLQTLGAHIWQAVVSAV